MLYSSHVYLAMEVLAGHQHLHWVMGTYLLTNLIFCPSSYPDDGLAPPKPCLLNALGIIAGEKQKNIYIYPYLEGWRATTSRMGGFGLRVSKVVWDVRLAD
jgi:hypothetical protein